MSAWTNAEIHVYLDRHGRWRARVRSTVNGEPVSVDVPPRVDGQAWDRAHGFVPLCLQLAEALDGLGRKGGA